MGSQKAQFKKKKAEKETKGKNSWKNRKQIT